MRVPFPCPTNVSPDGNWTVHCSSLLQPRLVTFLHSQAWHWQLQPVLAVAAGSGIWGIISHCPRSFCCSIKRALAVHTCLVPCIQATNICISKTCVLCADGTEGGQRPSSALRRHSWSREVVRISPPSPSAATPFSAAGRPPLASPSGHKEGLLPSPSLPVSPFEQVSCMYRLYASRLDCNRCLPNAELVMAPICMMDYWQRFVRAACCIDAELGLSMYPSMHQKLCKSS